MNGWRGALASFVPPAFLRRWSRLIFPPPHLPFGCRADDVRAANLSAVQEVLRAANVGFEVEPHGGRTRLVVSGSIATRDLRQLMHAAGLKVTSGPKGKPVGCDFRIGSQMTGIDQIDRALAVPLTVSSDAAVSQLPDLLEPIFDIDMVYTWVDGTDPEWQRQRRAAAGAEANPLLQTSNDNGRFVPHNELKYSLRSVDYFAPWIRNIYIVTSGQIPAWLDQVTGRIHVVAHEEIFEDPSSLPTFNSHAIEAQLHRIPGLAEHFIYMNDDVFLGQTVSPADFFTPDGHSRFFLSEQVIRAAGDGVLPVDVAAANNREVVEARFGRTVTRKFKHAPHAQLRSTLELIARENSEDLAATAASRFRSATDLSIPSSLAHYYGVGLGTAVPSNIGYAYTDISQRDAQLRLLRMLKRGAPQTFCLNEVEMGSPRRASETAAMLADFLPRAFPLASAHEIGVPVTRTASIQSIGIEGPNE